MLRTRLLAGSLLCGFLGWANPAVADVIVDWNLITTQAVVSAGTARPGPSALIDVAMVQLAMHDAVQAFQGRFESYGGSIANASGSPVAAVARAARDVLIGVGLTTTPSGSVDTLYTNYLSSRGLSNDAGLSAGQQAAAHLLALRVNNDGRVPPMQNSSSGEPVPANGVRRRSMPAGSRSRWWRRICAVCCRSR